MEPEGTPQPSPKKEELSAGKPQQNAPETKEIDGNNDEGFNSFCSGFQKVPAGSCWEEPGAERGLRA